MKVIEKKIEQCECDHCSKVYYNTPEMSTWLLCPNCMDLWFLEGCDCS